MSRDLVNLASSKLRKLTKRGFLTGCFCGCRGDYELTDAGRALIDITRA